MRLIVGLFLLLEACDVLTYLQAPVLEANPFAGGPPELVIARKLLVIGAALVILSRIPARSQPFAGALIVAIAAFSVGTNVASLAA